MTKPAPANAAEAIACLRSAARACGSDTCRYWSRFSKELR